MLNIFNKLIDANEREVSKLSSLVKKVNELEPKFKKVTDKQIPTKLEELKKRHQKGETLEKLLPEVFALSREASARVNDARLFDVQLMAATALHEGKIAEQKTGEGKTFTALSAAVLNALTSKGVHIVTVNDYLARRECGWVGPVYFALGLSCATIVHEEAFIFDPKYINKDGTDKRLKHLRPITRKEAYNADITYGTNNEFGFDYLRDNMAQSLEAKVQRGHNFAIVDEVDSILIDEARTPLIISSASNEPTDKYMTFTKVVDQLTAETDYVIDEKLHSASLTEIGILKIEKILKIDNLYEKDFSTLHHIEEALKARSLFQKDKDYVVRDGEVIIVDEFTGRLMPGRRYSEGLHQAIEAKEGVTIQQESKTWATISFQNYFRMYDKLAGMTGTASTEAEEFHKIYNLEVIVIPTNMPMVRKDYSDAIFKTQTAKYNAVAGEIEKIHASGQPVLVGTTSIEKNEFLSELLKRKGISHAILNAKNHEKEAEIIADAGQKGAVTVATNLAGRGVDIKLGKGVDKLGGLYVIGTERHESRRIDNQLRGRSGRQGDPGGTKFFVALDDDLMRIFGGEQVAKVMEMMKIPDDTPIEHSLVSRAIESAQKKVEGHNFDIRKHTVEYDDVMNQQRKIIYKVRDQILDAAAQIGEKKIGLKDDILDKVAKEIENIVLVNSVEEINAPKIIEDYGTIILFDEHSRKELTKKVTELSPAEEIIQFLSDLAKEKYEEREKMLGPDMIRQLEVFVYLQTMDTLWIEHLDAMDDLRAGIGLRGYAQRDPLVEYKKEGFEMFERLIDTIDSEVVHRIFRMAVEQPHIHLQPSVDISQAKPIHEEALDEQNLLEETGHLVSSIDKVEDSKKKDQNIQISSSGPTRVTVEKAGKIVSQNVYSNEASGLRNLKVGRNDPCPCGSGLKWKKCGLINAPQHNSAAMAV